MQIPFNVHNIWSLYLFHKYVSHHECRSKTSRVSVSLWIQQNLQTIAQREGERSMKVQKKY